MDSSNPRNYGMRSLLVSYSNPYDPCVLNLDYKGETCTLVLYVDDCFLKCHFPEALNYVEKKITEKYGRCTRTDGDVLPFVGMLFNFIKPGVVKEYENTSRTRFRG